MKFAIIIYSNDPETVWNALRFANTATIYDDEVSVFLLGAGVECMNINSLKYNLKEQYDLLKSSGASIVGCGICCESRVDLMPFIQDDLACNIGSMQDLYAIIKDADKVLTF